MLSVIRLFSGVIAFPNQLGTSPVSVSLADPEEISAVGWAAVCLLKGMITRKYFCLASKGRRFVQRRSSLSPFFLVRGHFGAIFFSRVCVRQRSDLFFPCGSDRRDVAGWCLRAAGFMVHSPFLCSDSPLSPKMFFFADSDAEPDAPLATSLSALFLSHHRTQYLPNAPT